MISPASNSPAFVCSRRDFWWRDGQLPVIAGASVFWCEPNLTREVVTVSPQTWPCDVLLWNRLVTHPSTLWATDTLVVTENFAFSRACIRHKWLDFYDRMINKSSFRFLQRNDLIYQCGCIQRYWPWFHDKNITMTVLPDLFPSARNISALHFKSISNVSFHFKRPMSSPNARTRSSPFRIWAAIHDCFTRPELWCTNTPRSSPSHYWWRRTRQSCEQKERKHVSTVLCRANIAENCKIVEAVSVLASSWAQSRL